MKEPHEVEQALVEYTHPDESRYQRFKYGNEKKYKYELEFNEYKTLSLLLQQVDTVQGTIGVGLTVKGMKPVVRQTDSSIEARIKAVVKETENRYEMENTQLTEFEE